MFKRKNSAIWKLTAWATALQLAMVIAGHYNAFVKNNLFAIVGMAISLIFGAIYGRTRPATKKNGAFGGAVVGGLSALIGIAACVALGDAPPAVLAFGTMGSTVVGLLGGLVFAAVSVPSPRALPKGSSSAPACTE